MRELLCRLEESEARPVPVPQMRMVMRKIGNASDFANSDLGGYGGKSVSYVAGIIDKNSSGNLNRGAIKSELARFGDWYFLHKIPVSNVNASTHGEVELSGSEDLKKPIVVNGKLEVIDGRHRVILARKKNVRELPAYMPATVLYNLIVR